MPSIEPEHDPFPESLVRIGLNDRVAALFQPLLADGLSPGRVARVDGRTSLVLAAGGPVRAEPSGTLLRDQASGAPPAVGDWVALRTRGEGTEPAIDAILPRSSQLTRNRADDGDVADIQVLAANVDAVLIVQAANNVNARRVQREVAQVWESGALPVVVLTKHDLVEDPDDAAGVVEDAAPGARIHFTNGLTGEGMQALATYTAGSRTIVLIGASGVGKSTLANRLLGEDLLDTGPVRVADNRGRHTTTARNLLPLPGGGALIDTPGLRTFGLWESEEGVSRVFDDVERFASGCRFSDCVHQGEPGCAVARAIADGLLDQSRLDDMRKLERELWHQQGRHHPRVRAENRRFGRMVRQSKQLRDRRREEFE